MGGAAKGGPGSRPRARKAQVVAAILADPSRTDGEIGAQFGISDTAVWRVRNDGALPRASAAAVRHRAIAARLKAAPALSLRAVAKEFGVSVMVVRTARKLLVPRGKQVRGKR